MSDKKEKRCHVLHVRVSAGMMSWLTRGAGEYGASVARMVRACILMGMRQDDRRQDEADQADDEERMLAEWEAMEPRERRRLGNG